MENGLFSEESFAADFGNDVVLFCHITSRVEGRENDGMLRDVGGNAFPTFVFLDAEGQVLGKHQGGRSVEAFQTSRKAIEQLLKAKARVAEGDESAMAAVLIAEMELGSVSFADAEKRFAELPEKTDAEAERIRGLLPALEFAELRGNMRQLGPEKFFAAVLEMVEGSRIPKGGDSWQFWYSGVMPAALQKEDAELARRALGELEKDPFFQGDNAKYLVPLREKIAELDGK